MGPFVPDIITDELNLVFGFLIGIAFGFVLEQAGFSSSRKLTGLFYGRDFTVLRVFFSAAITAMSGILLLSHFGMLDTEIIYINPTYLRAAIIGGLIMGVGFVVGGYCPGTSVCGAAIGKIDAMFFVGGATLGVFLFGEFYPLLEQLYNGSYLGENTVPSSLGLSPGLFALAIIAIAILAFIVTTKIERKISFDPVSKDFHFPYHAAAAIGILTIGGILLLLPDYKNNLLGKIGNTDFVNSHSFNRITSDELAFRLVDHDAGMQIIDVRDSASFARLALPGAIHIPVEEMFGKQYSNVLSSNKLNIILAEDEQSERNAALLAELLGYKRFRIVEGGFAEFRRTILAPAPIETETILDDTGIFRKQASVQIAQMIKERVSGGAKPVKQVKKIAGGCGA